MEKTQTSNWNLVAHLVSLMQTVGNFMWCWNCFLLLIIVSLSFIMNSFNFDSFLVSTRVNF
jgi:hypothetical protein